MAGYVPGPQATLWGQQRTAIGGVWPIVLVDLDLRYWADPISCEQRNRPSTRQLASAWGWKKSKVDRYLKRDSAGTVAGHSRDSAGTVDPDTKGPISDDRDSGGTVVGHSRDTGGTVYKSSRARPSPSPSPSPSLRTTTETPSTDGAPLSGSQMQKLIGAGITTAEAAAALTRSELLARPGIGPATVAKVEAWLASHGLELRPEKPKAAKPSAKPWTDLWSSIWLDRRGTPYQFGEWHRASAHALGLAEACRHDVETFKRCCAAFHRWIDQEDWKANPRTLERARYKADALLNERHVPKRGRFEMSDEARKENDRRGREIMERRAELALARGQE